MKNIHIIPTDKPSRLYDDGLELYLLIKASNSNNDLISYKNIYITSDEEIKEGDYMLLKYEHSHGRIRKCHYIYEEQLMIDAKEDIGFGFCKRNEVYKIILTTDQDLINDNVQAIDDEFLEWFVKNPSCEEVEIQKVYNDYGETDIFDLVCTPHSFNYQIIIPKEEQNTMKNIHIIPTDKPSRLYDDGLELYLLIKASNSNNDLISYKNIYITSDEEIKEGDYMLLKYEHSHGRIRKCHYIYEEQLMIDAKEDIGFGFCKRNEAKKIILTTDQDLIADGVQAIDDEFLEWFVKNPSCEEVAIQKVYNDYGETDIFDLVCTPHSFNYQIIIPKEEQNTMKNIHIIPTDKPSRLYDDGLELYLLIKASNSNNDLISYKNIYITSDEEIKEGDYMLLKYEHSHGRIRKCHYIYEEQLMIDAKEDIGFGFCKRNEVYKIILTTDQDLIKDGVQPIPVEFLEWFVENPSCEEVEIQKVYNDYGETDIFDLVCTPHSFNYQIIIPKEEPKFRFDNINIEEPTIKEIKNHKEEPKQCCDSGVVDDFCINTLKCKHAIEEPKQETLEEAAKNYAHKSFIWPLNKQGEKQSIPPGQLVPPGYAKHQKITTKHFINGAKWQQEQDKKLYNEEEVHEIILSYQNNVENSPNHITYNEWFEQFKKK
jgi:hypothetical protein